MIPILSVNIILGYVSLLWVTLTIITSILHKYDIHTFDKYLCYKCITFWTVLLITFDPFTAAVCALLMYILDKLDNQL